MVYNCSWLTLQYTWKSYVSNLRLCQSLPGYGLLASTLVKRGSPVAGWFMGTYILGRWSNPIRAESWSAECLPCSIQKKSPRIGEIGSLKMLGEWKTMLGEIKTRLFFYIWPDFIQVSQMVQLQWVNPEDLSEGAELKDRSMGWVGQESNCQYVVFSIPKYDSCRKNLRNQYNPLVISHI